MTETPESRKAELCDRRIDDTLIAKLLPQAASHLVSTVVLSDLFAHDKNVLVSEYLFAQRLVQCITNC